jgi:DnaD/phage-associated family protein
MDKKSYYAIIPANVRYDDNLKDKAKLLYGEITALCNEKGYCWATNEYFANLYNVSKTTISTLIKNLIDNGYIYSSFIYKENSKEIDKRILSITNVPPLKNFKDPLKENLKTPLKNFKDPLKENLKDNNTINNTINNSNSYYYIEEQFGRTLAPVEYTKIDKWKETFSDDIINYATDIAILNGVKNFNYIDGIIRNWKDKNIKSIKELKNETLIEKSIKKELFDYNWLEEE